MPANHQNTCSSGGKIVGPAAGAHPGARAILSSRELTFLDGVMSDPYPLDDSRVEAHDVRRVGQHSEDCKK